MNLRFFYEKPIMEVASYISIGALGAFLLTRLVDVFQTWLSSPAVQQLVNMTLQIRESLPPSVVEIGTKAILLVQSVLYAVIQVLGSLPPVVLESVKFVVIHIAKLLHLVVHIGAQLTILLKNLYHVVVYAGKSVFIVIRSVNNGFEYLWNFPDNVLNPLLNWMTGYPVGTSSWRVWFLSICFVVVVSWILKMILRKKKLKSN